MRAYYLAAVAGLVLAACTPDQTESATPAPASAPAEAASTQPLPLPVSLNAVMVAMVDFAADGIWRPAASETPLTDRQWLLVEQDAVNLIASASLITMPGTGVNDATWITEPDWRNWTKDMQAAAERAKAAVDAKDQNALKVAGDQLVEVCQACHQKYKAGLPSMGITRFPIYPKRDGT
jgi:hypothetical protein